MEGPVWMDRTATHVPARLVTMEITVNKARQIQASLL